MCLDDTQKVQTINALLTRDWKKKEQVENILPRVLATLSNRKRRELANQWHVDSDSATKLRRPRALQPRASFVSMDGVPDGAPVKDQNITPRKTPGRAGPSEAVTGAEGSPGLGRPFQGGLDPAERAGDKNAQHQSQGRLVEGAGVTHGGGRKGDRDQVVSARYCFATDGLCPFSSQ